MRKIVLYAVALMAVLAVSATVFAHGGPGLFELRLFDAESGDKGLVKVYNSPKVLHVKIIPDGWLIKEVQIYAGQDQIPNKKGKPKTSEFPFRTEYAEPSQMHDEVIQLDRLGFSWGAQAERIQNLAVHVDLVRIDMSGEVVARDSGWALGPNTFAAAENAWWFSYELAHPMRGQFIDAPVRGLGFSGPTQQGVTGYDEDGFEDEQGGFLFFPDERIDFSIGSVPLGTAVADQKVSPLDLFSGAAIDDPRVNGVARILQSLDADQSDGRIVLLPEVTECFEDVVGNRGINTIAYDNAALVDSLVNEAVQVCNGAGGAELLVVSVSEAEASLEAGLSASGIFRKNIAKTADWAESNQKLEVMPVYFPGVRSDGEPSLCADGSAGVAYQEWRMNGDPAGEECDPRLDGDACVITEIECREVAKPLLSTYMQQIDIFDESVTTDFYPARFSFDIITAISRDDGATWKRMNVSRMADLSSFSLETGEPFAGTCNKPQLKVLDNKILVAWVSAYARGGNPRYAISTCDNPLTPDVVETPETGCQVVCRGDAEHGTEVCEPDYPYDDAYYVEDIWGVRGQQGSVDYDEVDDVADLEIGEIPYSALWAARGVIVTQADIDSGKFASVAMDDPATQDINEGLEVGEIIWFKPERLTSARRDAYIPVVGATRGAGFSIAWQEDPEGLRPGKGKGPGEGWSGAISNHKTDIWYSYVRVEDFDITDANFVPGGTPDEERPGVGRPKALVPFSLPVRVSDNDMLNTDTLKVELDGSGLPVVIGDTYTPIDPLSVEHGNAAGTKRYAYQAKTDPLYAYYLDKLDLCDTSSSSTGILTLLPGTSAHERWYRFTNTEGSEKTVCITSDGRLIDGDVSASRPNISLQPYTRSDGSKSAWVLLAYEESKGMGESLGDEIVGGEQPDKPIKQDMGKNVIYHSFDFMQPDLVAPGHIVNLPALCGGLYPDLDIHGDGTACTPGQPIPIYFDDAEGNPIVDSAHFMQYRTEIARRVRFIAQSSNKVGNSGLIAAVIYKQGQEGQGRPADVFIRRIVVPDGDTGNPYRYENFECEMPLSQTFGGIPAYYHNVWGEETGDPLCGGTYFSGGYMRRDHVNLTSADIDLAVDAGPADDTPDDPTDDIYGTKKVLLWSQHVDNLGDESYGPSDNSAWTMYSNARSHRGFIRGDFLATAYAYSPNWAAGRNGNDRYNFYLRKSFDGGMTWTTTPAAHGGVGVNYCREWRSDPTVSDFDGTGNAPPVYEGFDPVCVDWCPPCIEGETCECTVTGESIAAGSFQPAIKVSEFDNNQETSSDPRIGATPPVQPLDGRSPTLASMCPQGSCRYVEDTYVDNIFFVAWGAGDNLKSTGGMTVTPEAPPTDVYYTRSVDFGDHFLKIPWDVNGDSGTYAGETVWRYQRLAWGDPEQGECQLRATPDGSKMYGIYHQATPAEEDPNEPVTRWYPWEPDESFENDLWFRRVIFWPDGITAP
jgi:hypothetical protein